MTPCISVYIIHNISRTSTAPILPCPLMLTDITADWNSDTTAHDDRLLKYKPSEYINFG